MSYKVDIIPGHGGFDSGAINKTNGIRECDGNLAVALKLGPILKQNGINFNLSRTTDVACGGATTSKADINNQISFGNKSDANTAVSIHFNGSENASAHGVEALYSQYNGLTAKNIKLANAILDEVVKATGLSNRGIKDAEKSVGVIRDINKPVALIECAFVTNVNESQYASNEQKQNILARAIAKGICNYFGVEFNESSEDHITEATELATKITSIIQIHDMPSLIAELNLRYNGSCWWIIKQLVSFDFTGKTAINGKEDIYRRTIAAININNKRAFNEELLYMGKSSMFYTIKKLLDKLGVE